MSECKEVFHQEGGLLCEKTIQLENAKAQLYEAEEVIKYYADKNNWFSSVKRNTKLKFELINRRDTSKLLNIFIDSHERMVSYGGKRARDYLKKYKGHKDA